MVRPFNPARYGSSIDLTAHIRPGDTVLIGQGTAEPRALVEALVEQRHRLGGVTLFVGASFTGTIRPEHGDAFRFIGLGGVGETTALTRAGVLDVLPVHLGTMVQLIRERRIPVNVVLAQLSPPDAAGRHSLGLVADYLQAAISVARTTLAEVNPHVPFTDGDTIVDASQLAAVVHDDRPLLNVARRRPSGTDDRIAGHVADLIPDGATLQVGVGATPDAVLARLVDRVDLGIHTGLMTEALLDLINAGAVTNERKEIDRGLTVTGALFGTERLYAWADRNPTLRMRSVSHTHDASVLAAFQTFFAINSAIEVDLTGQINAETMAGQHVALVGGQGSYTRAGLTARNGRSIIALPSTARGGTVSRIVARLGDGVVSTSRADADVFVTEHGIADLRGVSVSDRMSRMIAIADPAHREELRRHA